MSVKQNTSVESKVDLNSNFKTNIQVKDKILVLSPFFSENKNPLDAVEWQLRQAVIHDETGGRDF